MSFFSLCLEVKVGGVSSADQSSQLLSSSGSRFRPRWRDLDLSYHFMRPSFRPITRQTDVTREMKMFGDVLERGRIGFIVESLVRGCFR